MWKNQISSLATEGVRQFHKGSCRPVAQCLSCSLAEEQAVPQVRRHEAGLSSGQETAYGKASGRPDILRGLGSTWTLKATVKAEGSIARWLWGIKAVQAGRRACPGKSQLTRSKAARLVRMGGLQGETQRSPSSLQPV